jgi:UDP-N-acetylmuramate dehydrogenase
MKIVKNKNIRNLNTLKVESIFEYYVKPDTIAELKDAILFAKKNRFTTYFIGNGSNTLFSKEFYRKNLLIDLKGFDKLILENDYLYCECGVLGMRLINFCIKNSISGFEFLAGIPGTVGGFIKMNAGSFSTTISDILEKVDILDLNKMNILELNKSQLNFEYRKLTGIDDKLILGGYFKYSHNSIEKIKSEIKRKIKLRREKQPKGFSCGSVFKNSKSYYAGKLIEDAGLKGKNIGDAAVSEKHANFIINRGKAKGRDVLKLIETIENEVKHRFNINLEREVIVY